MGVNSFWTSFGLVCLEKNLYNKSVKVCRERELLCEYPVATGVILIGL